MIILRQLNVQSEKRTIFWNIEIKYTTIYIAVYAKTLYVIIHKRMQEMMHLTLACAVHRTTYRSSLINSIYFNRVSGKKRFKVAIYCLDLKEIEIRAPICAMRDAKRRHVLRNLLNISSIAFSINSLINAWDCTLANIKSSDVLSKFWRMDEEWANISFAARLSRHIKCASGRRKQRSKDHTQGSHASHVHST